jgi:hypothetical protein
MSYFLRIYKFSKFYSRNSLGKNFITTKINKNIFIKHKENKYKLIILSLFPIASFGLGCWQVQRLDWKVKLIDDYEDRLNKPPITLPPKIR